jgi:hypothetical protein
MKLQENVLAFKIAGTEVLFKIHAVPAGLNVATARELVGRPFQKDHFHANQLKARGGPIHLIGCSKAATEAQATSLLGFPDAIIVKSHLLAMEGHIRAKESTTHSG